MDDGLEDYTPNWVELAEFIKKSNFFDCKCDESEWPDKGDSACGRHYWGDEWLWCCFVEGPDHDEGCTFDPKKHREVTWTDLIKRGVLRHPKLTSPCPGPKAREFHIAQGKFASSAPPRAVPVDVYEVDKNLRRYFFKVDAKESNRKVKAQTMACETWAVRLHDLHTQGRVLAKGDSLQDEDGNAIGVWSGGFISYV